MADKYEWTPATRVLAGVAIGMSVLTATMESCSSAEPDPRPEVVRPDDEPTSRPQDYP